MHCEHKRGLNTRNDYQEKASGDDIHLLIVASQSKHVTCSLDTSSSPQSHKEDHDVKLQENTLKIKFVLGCHIHAKIIVNLFIITCSS